MGPGGSGPVFRNDGGSGSQRGQSRSRCRTVAIRSSRSSSSSNIRSMSDGNPVSAARLAWARAGRLVPGATHFVRPVLVVGVGEQTASNSTMARWRRGPGNPGRRLRSSWVPRASGTGGRRSRLAHAWWNRCPKMAATLRRPAVGEQELDHSQADTEEATVGPAPEASGVARVHETRR